jgi:PHD/YefM family antitoxin component YafN of YafNO toxin-antitoxin module
MKELKDLSHVGAREFRERLSKYLDSPSPVAITRHGRTVGYYIPAQQDEMEAEREALRQAVGRLRALMEQCGISEDEVVREFASKRASKKAEQAARP